jgi:hypothetical protein
MCARLSFFMGVFPGRKIKFSNKNTNCFKFCQLVRLEFCGPRDRMPGPAFSLTSRRQLPILRQVQAATPGRAVVAGPRLVMLARRRCLRPSNLDQTIHNCGFIPDECPGAFLALDGRPGILMQRRRAMRWLRNIAMMVLMGVVMLQLTGCALLLVGGAAAGAAAAGVMYNEGELRADLEAKPPEILQATERAFRDLIWTKESAKASATDGLATARTATGREVTVTINRKTENVSRIGIRIGTFGDENLSRLLYDKILFFLKHS